MTSLDSQIAKLEKQLQKKPDPLLADILVKKSLKNV
jgi:hypothetical protein